MVGPILIVDPDTRRRANFRGAFNAHGVEVLGTEDPTQAAGILGDGAFDAVVFTVGARKLALQRLVSETKRQLPAARLVALVPEEQEDAGLHDLGAPQGLSFPIQLGVEVIVSRIIEALDAAPVPSLASAPVTPAELPPPLPRKNEPAVRRYEAYQPVASDDQAVVELTRGPSSYDPILLTRASDALAASAELRAAFVAAAQSAEGVSQVNLPIIREIGGADDVPYLAVAVPPGRSLMQLGAQLVAAQERLPSTAAVFVVAELALGAGTLHRFPRKSLVHGAIDPNTVWLGQDGRVLLLQTGLGRFLRGTEFARRRNAQLPLEDPYWAPEDLRGAKISPATDVYLLGVLLYELLMGRAPFADKRGNDLERAILEENPPDPHKTASIPRELSHLVMETLSKDPERRATDGATLNELLSAFLTPQQNGLIGRLFAKKSAEPASPRDELVDWLHRGATST